MTGGGKPNGPGGPSGQGLGRAFVLGAALLLGLLLGWVFFSRFTPLGPLLLRHGTALLGAAAVLLAAFGAGEASVATARRVFAWAGLPRGEAPDLSFVDCLLIGVPSYGLILALVALSPLPLGPSAAVFTLVADAAVLLARGPFLLRGLSKLGERVRSLTPLWILLFGPPLLLALSAALAPVNSPDELVYKLAVPKAYLLAGGMVEMPLNSNSYFPAALGMADLAALVLAGGSAAKVVHAALFLLSLRVLARLADRVRPGAGTPAAVAAAWTPALLLPAGWCWAEWPLIGLLLLAVEAGCRRHDEPTSTDASTFALALGAALSVKYTALPWALALVPVLLWNLRRFRRPWPAAAVCAAAVFFWGSFYYLRNLIWTGSPVAPFLLPDAPAVANYRSAFGGLGELLRGWDIFHPGIVDDSLGAALPLLVLLSPLALWRGGRIRLALFWVGASQLAFYLAMAPSSRLMAPALLPLALLGAAVLSEAWRGAGVFLRTAGAALAGLLLLGQGVLSAYVLGSSYEPLNVLVGAESPLDYLHRTRNFMAPYDWINANLPPGGRVLLLGENRPFYLERPWSAAGNLDGPRVAAYLGGFRDGDSLYRGLRSEGITHVLVHKSRVRLEGQPGPDPTMIEREYLLLLPKAAAQALGECLTRRAKVAYEDGAYAVYALEGLAP
ncbi:MAG: hypothetical protein ACOYXN_01620 [Acidobacteriota bacterium]